MSVPFQESLTMKNLMRAFAGESQARNRYTFAAGVCRKQNLQVLETVFLFTADQEKEHAEVYNRHLAELNGSSVAVDGAYPVTWTNDALDLLQQAVHNEEQEYADAYPAFAQVAQEEGFPQVADSFRGIAEIEGLHSRRFRALASLLEKKQLFVSDVDCGWMCLNCGHIVHGKEAPKACPVCQHDQGYFIRLELAPYTCGPMLRG